MEDVELVIVGAGFYGITAAVTYHRLHPDSKILLVDAAPEIGGPWAPSRIFPGLKTNNLWGTYENPDFIMDEKKFGVEIGKHVPAAKVTEYLKAMAEENDIASFFRLNTRVEVVEQVNEGHTLIIGAGKSAWDIAYACATQPNSTATMLIRPSGNGPVWMSPPYVTPLGLWLEKLVFTRFFGFMSPCPWAETSGFEGFIRRFLHGTWLGRKICGAFWGILGDDVVQLNKLNEHPETKKLRPWRDAFESGNALSILNYPTDFFDLVREGKIKIVVEEVDRFSDGKEVILKDGTKLQVNAVVCATGWTSTAALKFLPVGLEKTLGLPTTNIPDVTNAALAKKVEGELYEQFPYLKERDTSRIYHPDPSLRHTPTSDPNQQPYRLYRFLVPPSDIQRRSIGFAGALMSLGNASCAYLQSLWLTAYFDGTLVLSTTSKEQIEHETYRDTEYCKLRGAMGYGNKFPDLVFDSLPYFDKLLGDLGFEGKRKPKVAGVRNWRKEAFVGYAPGDYRGLVKEWEERNKGEGKKDV